MELYGAICYGAFYAACHFIYRSPFLEYMYADKMSIAQKALDCKAWNHTGLHVMEHFMRHAISSTEVPS
jgi:hypothetical protein